MLEKEEWKKEIINCYEKGGYHLKKIEHDKKMSLTFKKEGKEKEVVLTWDDYFYEKLKPLFLDSPFLHTDRFQIPGTTLNMFSVLFKLEGKRYKFTIRRFKEGVQFHALVNNKEQNRFEKVNDVFLTPSLRENLMQKQRLFFEAYENAPSIRLRTLFQKKNKESSFSL